MPLDIDQITRDPFAIGAAGAAVTALRFTPGASWWERALNIAAGSAMAGFLSPALTEWLHLTAGVASGTAFLVGLLGMSLCAAALDWIRSGKLGAVIDSWTTRKG